MNFYIVTTGLFAFLQFVIPSSSPSIPALLVLKSIRDNGSVFNVFSLQQQEEKESAPRRIINDSLGVDLTATSSMAIDVQSGTILWAKNPDEVRSIASITKLATLMVALDNIKDLDRYVEVTPQDYVKLGFNTLPVTEFFTVRDIVVAVAMESSNTAAQVLARVSGLEKSTFIKAMNEKVSRLRCSKTKFVDTTGLSAENVSTAREVLNLAQTAFDYPLIRQFASKKMYTVYSREGKEYRIRSTNQLLGSMISIIAGKTGFVSESGYNLVAEAQQDGHTIIATVLGSATNEDRFQDFKMLAYWIFQNFTWQ